LSWKPETCQVFKTWQVCR